MSPATGIHRAQFDRVSLEFGTPKGKLRVVEDVSYTINDGDFIAVIGPSGCGKTTMMSMLAGFQKPTTGKVLFDGQPVKGPGPERGVIFQEYGVFPWLTVRENIAFGLKLKANHVAVTERDQICEHYLALMGLSDFANSYPKHLSGGMRQRRSARSTPRRGRTCRTCCSRCSPPRARPSCSSPIPWKRRSISPRASWW
jgi:NitT/TauT family transport system ATP-binding protein